MGVKSSYRSVTITRVFMKIIGFWYVKTKREERILLVLLLYTIWAIIFAIGVEGVDLYHCMGDFNAVTYNLCATVLLVMILTKLGSFLAQRSLMMGLIKHAEDHFWNVQYDQIPSKIMKDYDARGMIMSYWFTFIVVLGTCDYIFAPIFENMERNASDRVLPFKLWVNLPLTVTPWYEITYTIQSLSTIHSGICTFCLDNFVCMMTLHSAAQMKILGYRVQCLGEKCVEAHAKGLAVEEATEATYTELKKCIQNHYILIEYFKKLNKGFSVTMFGELLLASVVICIGGFQFLTTESFIRRFIFVLQLVGSLSQLLMYTSTCNDVIVQSMGISDAAYSANWEIVPQVGFGKAIKNGLSMIIIRARRPCALTAANFAVMSLETFTSVQSST